MLLKGRQPPRPREKQGTITEPTLILTSLGGIWECGNPPYCAEDHDTQLPLPLDGEVFHLLRHWPYPRDLLGVHAHFSAYDAEAGEGLEAAALFS
jgi:hypothetical protein